MLRSSGQEITKSIPSEPSVLSQRVDKVLRLFGRARAADGMTADEVLIFLALGHLDKVVTSKWGETRPVTCLDLAELLNIPKETVRRRVARLVELDLATLTKRGALMKNGNEWRKIAEYITNIA
jgi:hypothetical protein